MISQFYHKQKSKIFGMSINSQYKVNNVSNWLSNSIIKAPYLFGFNQMLLFHFKNFTKFFHKFFINKIISTGKNIY